MYRHLLADLKGIDAARLQDAAEVMALLERSLLDAGFHIVKRAEHRFDEGGEGFTGVFILSESHAVVHTYPEYGYLAFDLFSCGPSDPRDVLEALRDALGAEAGAIHEVNRGSDE